MKNKWHCLLAGLMILFCLMIAEPVHAKDKHVSDCLDGDADCLEELEHPDREDAPADAKMNEGTFKSGNMFFTIVKMIVALLLVLALIYFLLFLMKRKNNVFKQDGVIENIGGVSVGQQKSVQIIRIGGLVYVIGVGENVELLNEITDETVIQELLEQQAAQGDAPSFLEAIFPKKQKKQAAPQKLPFTAALQQELTKLQKKRQQMSEMPKNEEDRDE